MTCLRVLAVTALGALALAALVPAASSQPPPYAVYTWPGAVLLSIGTLPPGQSAGYVRSTPYYIDCPYACVRPFDVGQTVTLSAYPSSGFEFTGWTGPACRGQGNPCTFTIEEDTGVGAVFVRTG